jgi:Spy/CpxP family protein refolding chaperone
MLRTVKIAMVLLVTGIFLASSAFAYEKGSRPGPDKEGRQGMMEEKMAKELNLTADQQAKLKANKEAKAGNMKALHEAMKANREKFKEALKQPGVTKASMEPIVAETKSLQAQMVDQRVDSILAVKGILTQEQFEKFQNKFDEKKAQYGERAKKWHGR